MTKQERKRAALVAAMLVAAATWHLERRNAKTLLRVEQEALREAQKAIREAGGELSGAVADDVVFNAASARERAVERIHAGIPLLSASLAAALLRGRRRAREAGAAAAEADVKTLAPKPTQDAILAHRAAGTRQLSHAKERIDAATAQVRAGALASSWGSAAIAKLEEALAGQTSVRAALLEVTQVVSLRAERTVATEVAAAFNETKIEELEALLDRHPDPGWFKTWSAYLDAKTCSICWRKDGETVPVGKPFRDNLAPPAHPFCRCIVVLVFLPKPAILEALGWDYEAFKDEVFRELLEMDRTRSATKDGDRYAPAYIELAKKIGSPKTLMEMVRRGDFLAEDDVPYLDPNVFSHLLNASEEERGRALSPKPRYVQR